MAYIHKVDTDTLGRKITIYGLDVIRSECGEGRTDHPESISG